MPSAGLVAFFVVQVLLLALFWIRQTNWRIAIGLTLWLATTAFAAGAGWLQFGPLPPPIGFVIIPGLMLTVWLAFSRTGSAIMARSGVPLLIGFQSFRILVEIFLWWGHREGLVPIQITWEGRNFDVLTGLAAVPLAWLAATGKASRTAIWLWNLAGLGLLLNVVTVALLSTPTPFQQFSPVNVFVADAPFVWLPAFLVPSAFLGHLLVWRSLRGR